jgi:pyruvate dehydrogenase E1 component
MNEKELREFRARFDVPISDEDVVETPFYRPAKDSPEIKVSAGTPQEAGRIRAQARGQGRAVADAAAGGFSRFAQRLGRRPPSFHHDEFCPPAFQFVARQTIGRAWCRSFPDEARTFGIDPLVSPDRHLFFQRPALRAGGQKGLSYYHEAKDGQILEEGITEAGSMASFVAAGTAYANHGVNLIPFYIYYSMFGPQRVGDEIWLAGDSRAKGFLLGATSGRTTLNGEGLQHQDGHSPLLASTVPTLYAYDPAFAYEIAVIICDGMKRMFEEGRGNFLLPLPVQRELPCRPCPRRGGGHHQGTCTNSSRAGRQETQGAHFRQRQHHPLGLAAQEILAERYDVSADVWSATSYKNLRNEALLAERWNMLHPTEPPKKPYVQQMLERETGPFIAVSDYMKIVPDQIAKWVPGGLTTLGTDGFGRSDTRRACAGFLKSTPNAWSWPRCTRWRNAARWTAKSWPRPLKT